LGLSDFDAASRDFLKAIEIRPNYAPAHAHLGRVYAKTGKREEALKEFAIAIKLAPDYGRTFKYRAELYTETGDKEKAEADEREVKRVGVSSLRIIGEEQ
jgi:Tfp pilus assembly protein PilF